MTQSRQKFMLKIDEARAVVELSEMTVSASHLRPGRREGDDVLEDPVMFHALWLEDDDGYDHELSLEPGLFDAKVGDTIHTRVLSDGKVIRFLSLVNARTGQRVTVNSLSSAVVDCHLTESRGEMVGRISLAALGSLVAAYVLSLLYVVNSWMQFAATAAVIWMAISLLLLRSRRRRVQRWSDEIGGAPDLSIGKKAL
ncbi:hypothetical protein [uncultured Abyssibacter sp.]|uniref:hypothetical protein n=1 Tax=uncultured Abyssibacter sp. TaxID=2320202 RepID=UPI0032B30CC8